MKRTKEEALIAVDREEAALQDNGVNSDDNDGGGMIENAKMEIIPVSTARKRARITCVQDRRQDNNNVPRYQYEPLKVLDTRNISAPTVEVRICSTHITAKNAALKKRCLWGWKTYSCDSDLVCILVHLGFIPFPTTAHTNSSSKSSNNHNAPASAAPFKELIVTLEILDDSAAEKTDQGEQQRQQTRITLPSHEYNGLRSRFWEAYRGARIAVKGLRARDGTGSILPVAPHVIIPSVGAYYANPLRCCFDSSNNPALVYSLFIVADRKTPKRLSKEVLYIEDDANRRYEISRCDKKQRAAAVATVPEDEKKKGLYVRFGTVDTTIIMNERKRNHPKNTKYTNTNYNANTVPLKEQFLTDSIVVKWSTFKWSPAGLVLGNTHYKVRKISFKPKKSGDGVSSSPPLSDANIKPSTAS